MRLFLRVMHCLAWIGIGLYLSVQGSLYLVNVAGSWGYLLLLLVAVIATPHIGNIFEKTDQILFTKDSK